MAYICPRCGAVSHNPHDEAKRYCGRCHKFEEDDELLNLLRSAGYVAHSFLPGETLEEFIKRQERRKAAQ